MWMLVAAWSFAASRRLFQIGILLAGIGSGFLGLAAAGKLLRPAAPPDPETGAPAGEGGFLFSPALMIASVLLVAGFVLMLLSVHFGVSPWSPRRAGAAGVSA